MVISAINFQSTCFPGQRLPRQNTKITNSCVCPPRVQQHRHTFRSIPIPNKILSLKDPVGRLRYAMGALIVEERIQSNIKNIQPLLKDLYTLIDQGKMSTVKDLQDWIESNIPGVKVMMVSPDMLEGAGTNAMYHAPVSLGIEGSVSSGYVDPLIINDPRVRANKELRQIILARRKMARISHEDESAGGGERVIWLSNQLDMNDSRMIHLVAHEVGHALQDHFNHFIDFQYFVNRKLNPNQAMAEFIVDSVSWQHKMMNERDLDFTDGELAQAWQHTILELENWVNRSQAIEGFPEDGPVFHQNLCDEMLYIGAHLRCIAGQSFPLLGLTN